jgi:murein DD-endopeptidase / murein LD-carboxypeptidase
MMKKIALLFAGIWLLCILPFAAWAQAPIVSNQPHKAASTNDYSSSVQTKDNGAVVAADKQQSHNKERKAVDEAKNSKKKASNKNTVKSAKKYQDNRVQTRQSNWRLKVAQQKLQVLGLSSEKPSGQMTESTSTALKSFQKQHKLQANGKLDDATYRKLTWEAFTKEGIAKVQGRDIVSRAAKYKGVPYVFGGTTPKGFDCSGYVQYVFKDCKAKLPRLADEQALEGVFVTQKQLRPGDLVFFTTYTAGASHVGIYAGNGKFWSASSSRGVVLSSLKEEYWKSRYYGARRVLIANGEVK